ncbi:MAG: TadE/TadG family type IV pilus assembly protein [Alphaproteobacteria bacterium]
MLKLLRKWLGKKDAGVVKNEDGVVAIEFALVAVPFFTLVLGIIEVGLFFTSGSVLQSASVDAARMIRTGQVQASGDQAEEVFKNELCYRIDYMLKCDKVQYEVIHIASNTFGTVEDYEPQFTEDGELIPQGFSTGDENDVVLVRSYYKWEFLTPFLGAMMTGSVDKGWLPQMSTVAIKSEPYDPDEED